MTPAAHIITTIKALMSDYPVSHTERVIDALKRGTRVTPVEVAEACRVHRCTVWAWVKAGKLPAPRRDTKRWKRSWDYAEVRHLLK